MTQTLAHIDIEPKARFITVLVGAALCFSFLTLSFAVEPSAAPKSYWTNFLSDALSDQTLDVRDARNRPVTSRDSQTAFKELFVLTVFRFADGEFSPGLAQLRKMLADAINPLAQKLRAASACLWERCELFAAAAAKQFHHLVQISAALTGDQPAPFSAGGSGPPISFLTIPLNLPLRC